MEQPINMAEAKSRFSELVGQAAYGGRRFILRRRGQPMAVLMGMEEYKLLKRASQEPDAPLSAALYRRQEQLVAQAKHLRDELGDPLVGLAEILHDLPSGDDEFWTQIMEV